METFRSYLWQEAGVPLLEYRTLLPRDLPSNLIPHYEKVLALLFHRCKHLYSHIQKRYAAAPVPKKASQLRRLRFTFTVDGCQVGDCYAVKEVMSLSRGMEKTEKTLYRTFRLEDGAYLPLSHFLSKQAVKRAIGERLLPKHTTFAKIKHCPFQPSPDGILLCFRGKWILLHTASPWGIYSKE